MRSDRSQFEVRCPRCEVTFPIGTRICVHCGGPTLASHEDHLGHAVPEVSPPFFDFDSADDPALDRGLGDRGLENLGTEDRGSDPLLQGLGMGPAADYGSESDSVAEDDRPFPPSGAEAAAAEKAPTLGRSILGSMGNLIWIALLIAFSLSGRVCGE